MSPARPSVGERQGEIATIIIELKYTDPLIWREVEAPTSITLEGLHDIIQATMGWFNYHLWEFTLGKRCYGLPMEEDWGTAPREEAAKFRLCDLLKPGRTVLDYTYDFGDGWEHKIVVTNVRRGEPNVAYPRFVGGRGAGPPEDCGGVPGFYELLEARDDPDHERHEHAREWLDGYDPSAIDVDDIREALDRMIGRRNDAEANITKRA
jgi:hypothetical protein